MVNRLVRLSVVGIAAGGFILSVPAVAYADPPATGYGACVVRDAFTNLPAAPTTGQPVAGQGFAIKTVIYTSDFSQASAACTDAIYADLMDRYVNAGNTNRVQWEVAIYNSQDQPLASGCAASGCNFHPAVKSG
jgi:hypothetical protein